MTDPERLPIRPATAADETTIHRLIREARINPLGVRWENFVVLEDPAGEIIACGQVKPHRDGSWELASIVVDPAWQGRGLARRVIEHLIAEHPGTLYLMCRAELEPLYEKFGFRTVRDSNLPRYFRRILRLTAFADMLVSMPLRIMRRDARANGPAG